MEFAYHIEADVHFDEDDLKELGNLLRAIETASGDLSDELASYGQGAVRMYEELKVLVDWSPFR
jgi:hypothetical protein